MIASPSPITPSENTPSPTSFNGIALPLKNAFHSFALLFTSPFCPSPLSEFPSPPFPSTEKAECAACACAISANFFFPTIKVRINGTPAAIAMQIAKLTIYFGWMDKIPGSPPTPIAFAVVPVATHTTAAQAEPIIPHIKG